MTEPTPRPEIFNAYWEFAAERQRIFYRRLQGFPHPWTEDEVLGKYKFCNAFRASDRVSQYLLRHVIYGDHLPQDPENVLFRIFFFRFFNSIETWELAEKLYGAPSLQNFDVDRWYTDMDVGQGLFSAAYMTCGRKEFGYDKKHGNYLATVREMMDSGLAPKVLGAGSMAEVYDLILPSMFVGKFLAYQIATDVNYSDVVSLDDNSFTMAGPGAERGIKKVFLDTGSLSSAEIIQWMRARQDEEFDKRGVPEGIRTLWGHRLQAIDIQNLFCETDKYSRARFPDVEGGLAKRNRPKQNFRIHKDPLQVPFYPPKWGINARVHEIPEVRRLDDPLEKDLPWTMDW
jgi:hypothetical protein